MVSPRRLASIALDTVPFRIAIRQIFIRVRVALVGSQAKPMHCGLAVDGHSLTLQEGNTEVVLRLCQALLGSLAVPRNGLAQVGFRKLLAFACAAAAAFLIARANIVLRERATLVSCEPIQRLAPPNQQTTQRASDEDQQKTRARSLASVYAICYNAHRLQNRLSQADTQTK